MARHTSSTFTEVELEFMHIIWTCGEVTTEILQDRLREQGRELSDGSIRKILSILVRKGHLIRKKEGRGFSYRAKLPRNQSETGLVRDLLNRAFGGSVSLMAAALLKGDEVKPGDIEAIKNLIAEHERREGK
ncbi:MAG: BlaI/MecI/CopY family transcriptional regulator [Candidatus Latescibacterota bacterium]